MKHVIVPLLTLLLLGVATLHAPVSGQIAGDVETAISIVPTEAAPGQVFTVQGFNLFDPAHPELTEVRLTERATGKTVTTQALTGPTSAEAVYVRVPTGLALGNWQVRVAMLGWGVSGPVSLRLRSKPGTPIPMAVLNPVTPVPDPPPITTQVRRGQTYAIQAFGCENPTTIVQWSQPGITVPDPAPDSIVDPTFGIALKVMVPLALVPGKPALVQLKLTIAGVASDLSFALRVQVIE